MIAVTKLDGSEIFVNPDLVLAIEAKPDTRITFTNGHVLIVREDPPIIAQRIAQYRAAVLYDRTAPSAALRLIRIPEDG